MHAEKHMPSRVATGYSAWHWVIIIAEALAMKTTNHGSATVPVLCAESLVATGQPIS